MARSALIAGASGLVGGHLLRRLLDEPVYEHVAALGRRPLAVTHSKLTQHVIDFSRVREAANFPRADDVFCCLGTTIRTAGSQDAFYEVDFLYVHELARTALGYGATQFLLVSSVGANPRSRIFYSRVKGQVEEAVGRLAYQAVHIFRPSFLLGDRAERRIGERIGTAVSRVASPLLIGPFRKYQPIAADAVAAAMVRAALSGKTGVQVREGAELLGGYESHRR
jgi:uncharacterized protein YbjT (DUF2867 family)